VAGALAAIVAADVSVAAVGASGAEVGAAAGAPQAANTMPAIARVIIDFNSLDICTTPFLLYYLLPREFSVGYVATLQKLASPLPYLGGYSVPCRVAAALLSARLVQGLPGAKRYFQVYCAGC